MSDSLKIICGIAVVLAVVGAAVAWEFSLWSECRQTNSWFYCARVLFK
jgi:hypothetical protein